jgi:2Fe-2S ferredoxin
MPKITYLTPSGIAHTHEVPCGQSVMRGAVDHNLPGISADCGGSCACGTCEVVIDPSWTGKLPAPDAMELSMLDAVEDDTGGRRLSCQITVTNSLDGLVVSISKEIC